MAQSCPTARFGETARCQRGIVCLVPCAWWDTEMMRSSASLEGLSRLLPLNTLGRLYPQMFPPCTAACLPGVFLPAALHLFLAEPSAASSCFQMFPSAFHPAWLLSSKCRGPNTPLPVPQGCPRICVGDATARFYHPIKCSRLPGGKEDAGWCEPSLCFTISFLPL